MSKTLLWDRLSDWLGGAVVVAFFTLLGLALLACAALFICAAAACALGCRVSAWFERLRSPGRRG